MLQFSWVTNSYEGEIDAFDQLALQYFYLGDIEKTKYHKRSICGIREKVNSYSRITALEKFNKQVQEIELDMGWDLGGKYRIIKLNLSKIQSKFLIFTYRKCKKRTDCG